jgi:hypothetical protein
MWHLPRPPGQAPSAKHLPPRPPPPRARSSLSLGQGESLACDVSVVSSAKPTALGQPVVAPNGTAEVVVKVEDAAGQGVAGAEVRGLRAGGGRMESRDRPWARPLGGASWMAGAYEVAPPPNLIGAG